MKLFNMKENYIISKILSKACERKDLLKFLKEYQMSFIRNFKNNILIKEK